MPADDGLISQEEAAAELLGGSTPPAGGEQKPEPTLEEVAAKAEAELAAETPGTEPEKPSSKLKELIDSKYGGDEGKFVDGLHESWRSTAALKKELDGLKAEIAKVPDPEEELPPPTEAPDVKWFDGEITALQTEASANVEAQKALEAQGNAVKGEIHELRGELKRAEEVEKGTIEDRIGRKESRLEQLADKWQRLSDRNRGIAHQQRDFERQKNLAVREVEVQRAQLQQQKVELQNYQVDQGKIFNTALTEAIAEYQLPTADPEYTQYLDETIRAKVSYVLRSDPSGGPVDLAALAKQQVAAFAKAHSLTKRAGFVQKTQEKIAAGKTPAAVAKKPESPAAPAPAAPASPKKWTAEFARQRAMKILGG